MWSWVQRARGIRVIAVALGVGAMLMVLGGCGSSASRVEPQDVIKHIRDAVGVDVQFVADEEDNDLSLLTARPPVVGPVVM